MENVISTWLNEPEDDFVYNGSNDNSFDNCSHYSN